MYHHAEDRAYGCLFCRTGCEQSIAAELEKRYPGVKTLVPLKSRYWRHQGEAIEEQVVLFPSYIFFWAQPGYQAFQLAKHDDVYAILRSQPDDWRLFGSDRMVVEQLFETGGVIGISKAYFEGDRIRIAEGYLKAYEGNIVRVNRRAKTVQIKVRFQEKEMLIWLGYEEIDPC